MTTLYDILRDAGVTVPPLSSQQIRSTKQPMPHQVQGINQVLASPNLRFGLYDSPGVGKTLTAQAVLLHYALIGNKVLVVMPPSLIEQFTEALDDTFIGWRQFLSMHTLREGPDQRHQLFLRWRVHNIPDIMLMSYQMFAKVYDRAGDGRKKKAISAEMELLNRPCPSGVKPQDWQKKKKAAERKSEVLEIDRDMYFMLGASGQDVIVCDESHYLRKPNGAYKALTRYLKEENDKALVLMTGTPIFNTLADGYNSVTLTSPRAYKNKRAFRETHEVSLFHRVSSAQGNNETRWNEVLGYTNTHILSRNLYEHARRVTKEQVFDIKKPIVQEVPIKLAPAHKALYRKLMTERVLQVDGDLIDATTQQSLRQKALQIVAAPENFTDNKSMDNQVLEALDELLDDIGMAGKHEKALVFSNYHTTVNALMKRYEKFKPAQFDGQITHNWQEVSRKRFLEDDECRMMIAHPLSGGVGLNLQSVCCYAFFVEPVGIPGLFTQAAERIHRLGQTKVVTIYILKAIGTLYPKVISVMLGREKDSIAVMRDKHSLLKELIPDD